MTGIIVSRACALRDCFMGLRVMALGRHLAQSPGSSGGIRVRHFCLETMPGRPSLDCGTREVVEFHFSLTPTPKDQLLPNPCSTPSPPPPPSFHFYSTPSIPFPPPPTVFTPAGFFFPFLFSVEVDRRPVVYGNILLRPCLFATGKVTLRQTTSF